MIALALLAWSTAARAEPEAVDLRRAVWEAILLQTLRGEPVLLAVRGADEGAWRERIARVRPDLPLRVAALPEDQPIEVGVALALAAGGERCALSLEPAGDAWRAQSWGACAPGDGVLAEGPRALSAAGLRARGLELAAAIEGRVALAAVGEEAAREAAALCAGSPELAPVLLLPQTDLRGAMPRALAAAHAGCGLLAWREGEGSWRVEEHGACGPPPASAARVAAAFEGDPRPPEALLEATSLRLVEGPGGAWAVRDGADFPLSTLHLAAQLGDARSLRRLEREGRMQGLGSLFLVAGGGLLDLAGLVQIGLGAERARWAFDHQEEVDGEQLAWTGAVLLGAGSLLGSGGFLLRFGAAERRLRPDRFYRRDRAEDLIRAYDEELARALGAEPAAHGEPAEEEP